MPSCKGTTLQGFHSDNRVGTIARHTGVECYGLMGSTSCMRMDTVVLGGRCLENDCVNGVRSTLKLPSVRRPKPRSQGIELRSRKGAKLLVPLRLAASLKALPSLPWALQLPCVKKWDRGLRENQASLISQIQSSSSSQLRYIRKVAAMPVPPGGI